MLYHSWAMRLRNVPWKKKIGNVPFVGAYYSLSHDTHTRHISECFGNEKKRRCLFTPDLRLLKANTARDESISDNSRTQHWRTTNIWLVVASSQTLFLRWIAESSQPSIILWTMDLVMRIEITRKILLLGRLLYFIIRSNLVTVH